MAGALFSHTQHKLHDFIQCLGRAGVKNLQLTKLHKRKSKSNVVYVSHAAIMVQSLFRYLAKGFKEELVCWTLPTTKTPTDYSTYMCTKSFVHSGHLYSASSRNLWALPVQLDAQYGFPDSLPCLIFSSSRTLCASNLSTPCI